MECRVVITGLGSVSPIGESSIESWDRLIEGSSNFTDFHLENSTNEGSNFSIARSTLPSLEGVIPAKDEARLEPFVKLAIASANSAIKQSKIIEDGLDCNLIGTSFGVGYGSVKEMFAKSVLLAERGPRRISPFFIPYNISNMAAGMVANTFKLKGPNICFSTACTSGTVAIGQAYQYIKAGMATAMVCGGSEAAICPEAIQTFSRMNVLARNTLHSKTPSKPFDLASKGFAMSEGAAAVVLESFESAKERGAEILGEILGYSTVVDTDLVRGRFSGDGLYRSFKNTLYQAKKELDDIDYIQAHGNSFGPCDSYEAKSIQSLFKNKIDFPLVTSSKGHLGHCLGASGAIDFNLAILSLQRDTIPATLNTTKNHKLGRALALTNKTQKLTTAMTSSFGLGGNCASLCLSKAC